MDHSHAPQLDAAEPPDVPKAQQISWPPAQFGTTRSPLMYERRESLLTRQLLSETEHTDGDDDDSSVIAPPRALSTQSNWSNPSAASTAELTSDDGHSVSPAISPPLPATTAPHALPISEKPLEHKLNIVGQDDAAAPAGNAKGAEQAVEAGLGRKRCISFACRGKQEPTQPIPSTSQPQQQTEATPPPPRKCALKFICPTKTTAESKPAEKTQPKRPVSPPPPQPRRSSASAKALSGKSHRGSDSTVTHTSPKSVRRNPSVPNASTSPASAQPPEKASSRTYAKDSDESASETEATRFHEFATSEDEPDDWVQESTCHRSRLTINDTLKKENVIRKACEEVEEEAVEEDEEAEEELDEGLDELDDEDQDEDVEDDQDDEDSESDDGFHSDDEQGFANSDSEGDDDSDLEWWKPGGPSTASTSVEHLDRLAIVNSQPAVPGSSLGSITSGQISPHSKPSHSKGRAQGQTPAVPINRPKSPDLPDSTDFVCGTLDEDRPLEQAYINHIKMRQASKHKARPQDIDPTFPTSDPEIDEEDDEDLQDSEKSDAEDMVHGDLDEIHAKAPARRPSTRGRAKGTSHRSPPPPARLHSPAPKKKSIYHSPPPPTTRATARSPPPRKLFGHSPRRINSPAPINRTSSPPNSPTQRGQPILEPSHLAQRRQLTHTSSLPRGMGLTISKLGHLVDDAENDESDTAVGTGADADFVPKRREAIDIVKGLEKKRQRRKEKLYQKACAKAAAKGEKSYKVKPGRGAERMREVGLQLQGHHGKAEHILSL